MLAEVSGSMATGRRLSALYLRGVPEQLVRESKAQAARRGITLAAFVTEALFRALGAEPDAGRTPPHGLEADMAWYEANRDRLLVRYSGQYLAIVNGEVVDHDREFGTLARRVFERLGPRPVLMPRCVPGERVVSVPSPRVLRG